MIATKLLSEYHEDDDIFLAIVKNIVKHCRRDLMEKCMKSHYLTDDCAKEIFEFCKKIKDIELCFTMLKENYDLDYNLQDDACKFIFENGNNGQILEAAEFANEDMNKDMLKKILKKKDYALQLSLLKKWMMI